MAHATRRLPFAALTLGSLIAGMGLGALAHAAPSAAFDALTKIASPVGSLFITAIQGSVLPLIVALVLSCILSVDASTVGSLGWRTLTAIVAAVIGAAILALPAVRLLIAAMPLDADMLAALRRAAAATPVPTGAPSAGDWVTSIVPRNVIQSAAGGDIIQVLVFTIAFGLAASRLPVSARKPLADLASVVSAAMLKLVDWIVLVSPIGVFALAFTTSRGAGAGSIGVVAGFVLIVTILVVALGLLYYPIGAFGARVSVLRFAQALLPSQVVAFSTRSSLATLPTLVDAGKALRLPDAAVGFVMPLCAAVFRPTRGMISTARLLFLAYVYGVPLNPLTIATFIVSVTITSFTFAGVPLGPTNGLRSVPFYVAAGIPVEGVILLDGVEVLIDHGRTVVGVTANLALAAFLTRSPGGALAAAVDADPAPVT